MAIYKRGGKIYWYKFQWNGELIRQSAKTENNKIARQMEAAHRTSLAKGEVGIREKKRITLADFIKDRFEPWAQATFERNSPQTWFSWYRPSLRAILNYRPLCGRNLGDITSEHVSDFETVPLKDGRFDCPCVAKNPLMRERLVDWIVR